MSLPSRTLADSKSFHLVRPVVAHMDRAVRSLLGPMAFAGANFLVAVLLQQRVSASQFGLYAFSQVLIATGMSVSNGLFGGPLAVELRDGGHKIPMLVAFYRANAWFCVVASCITFGALRLAGADFYENLVLIATSAAAWMRWFMRSVDLALQRRQAAMLVDLVYALGLASFIGVLAMLGRLEFGWILLAQLGGTVASLATSLRGVPEMSRMRSVPSTQLFRFSFAKHGQWSLIAIMATQLTVNAPTYLITFILGASRFAPVALATLLFRPLGVVLTGLVQYEQGRMARRFPSGAMAELDADVRYLRVVVGLVWVTNVLAVGALLWFAPEYVFKEGYSPDELALAIVAIAVIVLVRSVREPQLTALQAGGAFRQLTVATLLCVPVPLAISASLLLLAPHSAAWSLSGPLIGEILGALLTRRVYRQLRRSNELDQVQRERA